MAALDSALVSRWTAEEALLRAMQAAGLRSGERENLKILGGMVARGVAASTQAVSPERGAERLQLVQEFVKFGSKAILLTGVERWEKINTIEGLAQRNESLTLHLVQGLDGKKMQYSRNAPEVDHIFPRAELRKKDYPTEEINHFADFWILAMGKNRNKSDRHPKEYFKDVPAYQLKAALIDPSMFDYRRFTTFLKERRGAILKRLEDKLELTDADF